MTEVLTSAQMRAIEQAAISSGGTTGLALMERAGAGLLQAVFARWPDLGTEPGQAMVLCGPGNNGGDGFVIARLLAQRGWRAECYLFGQRDRLPPDAAINHDRWAAYGPTLALADWRMMHRLGGAAEPLVPDLVIDAIFGTGLTRPLPEDLMTELHDLDAALPPGRARRVAVDAPSGLCMDSGRVLGAATGAKPLRQDLTVSFHRPKLGHVLDEGPYWCGALATADIGLDALPDGAAPAVATTRLARPATARLGKGTSDEARHKYDYGHALILSGGPGHTGAARLAARSALRVGAGLVTLAAPGTAMAETAAHLTSVMLTRCNGSTELEAILEDTRLNALCLGPGLGVGAGTRDLVATALASRRPTVLDADALSSFATEQPRFFAMVHSHVVLTPHDGEFARLFPEIWRELREPAKVGPAMSRLDAARAAAARARCTVLLKGADTIIADPDGRAVIHSAHYDRAAPWLATAGAGDVLSGLITGLLARGLHPVTAAETAAWLHVEAARSFGPGLIAEDLPERLPQVLRDLGL
ncbi:NAD(P)H-hydrate dehydratase [Tropicimonas sp. IMCC34043]|uniref:NAD(P)H-hydrate dehydratase n=1 Tax=Tropicimonas sp. IMCC34043 TaxID=2248760 RepID=UPI000E26651C|nr:NAD(P)H-hydrate dehydratase [Tropicimonas sp. IMCC34043]